MKQKSGNIGLNIKLPSKPSKDKHDPYFRSFGVRGRIFIGKVISTKSAKTAKIEFERIVPLPKYERFEKRRTRLIVHNPDSIMAQTGDIVKIAECRPISKTKNFVIIEKIENESS